MCRPADFCWEGFIAYLEEQGYQVIPSGMYDNLPHPREDGNSFFPPYVNDGYFAIDETDDSTYEVYVAYNSNSEHDHLFGTTNPEKPYYLRMKWNNETSLFDVKHPLANFPTGFATFDDAIAGAQDVIDYTYYSAVNENPPDLKAAILEKLGPGYSTAGIELGREVYAYTQENSMPDNSNDPDIAEKQHDWQIDFENWLKAKLKEYFDETYLSGDKIIFEEGTEYYDMMTEWSSNPFNGEPVTKYIKWNVSLSGNNSITTMRR